MSLKNEVKIFTGGTLVQLRNGILQKLITLLQKLITRGILPRAIQKYLEQLHLKK